MPQKTRITKEMIVAEAFEIARTEGADKITARRVAERLKCSTQPVLYNFATVDELKAAVYRMADEYHGGWLMNMERDYGDPMLCIGMNYIRFAVEEKNLFRLLFQSNEFSGAGLVDLVQAEELIPLLQVLQQEENLTLEEAREVFGHIFIYVHGYAGMFANNEMLYDENALLEALTKMLSGAVYAVKGC